MSLLNALGEVLNHFNFLDYGFLFLLICAMLMGGFKGFCRQLVSWFFWILAGYISYFYSFSMAQRWLSSSFNSPFVCVLVANLMLLLMVFLVVFLVNRLMQGMLMVTGLSVFDRFLGVYFGLIQGAALVACLVVGFSSTSIKEEPWWSGSRVVTMTSALMPIYASDMIGMIEGSFARVNDVMVKNFGSHFSWDFDPKQKD